jgi:hypothetical protein
LEKREENLTLLNIVTLIQYWFQKEFIDYTKIKLFLII